MNVDSFHDSDSGATFVTCAFVLGQLLNCDKVLYTTMMPCNLNTLFVIIKVTLNQ